MDAVYILSAGLEFFFALVSLILLVGCVLEQDRMSHLNRIFSAIMFTNLMMNVMDGCIWLWVDRPELLSLMKVLSFLSYFLGSMILVLLSYLLIGHVSEYHPVAMWVRRTLHGLAIVMVGMWFLSLFNGMYYYWDEYGACQVGDYFWLSQLFGVVFLIANIALVWSYRTDLGRTDCIILMLYNFIPLLSFAVSYITAWEVTPLYLAVTVSLMLYYIVLHVKRGYRVARQENQIIKQELELSKNQLALADARVAIMQSQIKPHFIYNTLGTIQYFCKNDPKNAANLVQKFAMYLRGNFGEIDSKKPIPIQQELAHVQNYVDIELTRFPDMQVIFDIQAKDFYIPALSIQPLVENAIKHGLMGLKKGGTVTIQTWQTEDSYYVKTADNGVGFDEKTKSTDPSNTHIGIPNIRERLRIMCSGTLTITSQKGEGTTALITLPKEKKERKEETT